MSEWVRVCDKLPRIGQMVLIFPITETYRHGDADYRQEVSCRKQSDTDEAVHWDGFGFDRDCQITHWMPLPLPPETGQ